MLTNRYTFNEKRKRLEPTSTLCQYCLKDFSTEMSDNYFVPIYNEQDRTFLVVYSSVSFKKILVGIPRCKKCKLIHHNSAIYSWFIGFVLACGVLYLVYSFVDSLVYLIFLGIFGFLIPLILSPPIFATIISARQGIFSQREGVENEPQIQQLIREGWTLSQPSA